MFDPKVLDTEIKSLEQQIKLKKLLKKELSRANEKAFVETSFGKGWMSMVRTMTKPFAKMHHNADLAVSDPKAFKREGLKKEGEKLLAQCKIAQSEDKTASKMAVLAAQMVLELEALGDDNNLSGLIVELDGEVQRLRPKRDEKKIEVMESLLNNLIAGELNHVK